MYENSSIRMLTQKIPIMFTIVRCVVSGLSWQYIKIRLYFLSRNVASGREFHPFVTKYSNTLRADEDKEHPHNINGNPPMRSSGKFLSHRQTDKPIKNDETQSSPFGMCNKRKCINLLTETS